MEANLSLNADYYLRILEATRQMAEQRMVQPLVQYVAAAVFDVTSAERCLIVFFADDGTPSIQAARTRQGTAISSPEDQFSRSILQHVRATLAPLLIEDALDDRLLASATSVRSLGLRSVMCVPLVGHGSASGAIYVENRKAGGQFVERDLVPLVLFANQVAVALGNVRLVESLEATVAARTEALSEANTQLEELIQQRSRQLHMTEQALQVTEEAYALISEHTSDLIALLHVDGIVHYASPSHRRLLGRRGERLPGVSWLAILSAQDRPLAEACLRQAVVAGASECLVRLDVDDRDIWVEARFSLAPQQSRRYVAVIARDVTVRRELERRLQQAQKMEALGRLAGGVAHDLRNLVMVINNSAYLVAGALPDDHPARADVDAIRDVGDQVARLTHQLLSFARHQPISPSVLRLDAILDGMLGLLTRVLGREITLSSSASPGLWPITVDQGQIEQVIVNMTINARDAMRDGGALTIDLVNVVIDPDDVELGATPGDYVSLSIADTGEGIAPEALSRIFEPFYTTKGLDRGIGLGLAICYGIVTQCGGAIGVRSAPGAGTTFTVLLPRADGAAAVRSGR